MTYSVPLVTTDDYVSAINDQKSPFDTDSSFSFGYSVFYIYFEQYLHIDTEALRGVLVSIAVVGVASFLLILHPLASLVSIIALGFIETDLMAVMYLWDIDLNAISVVNLITSVGLAVENTAHFTRGFMAETDTDDPNEKAARAMTKRATSVMNGMLSVRNR
jgi:Niemann-Pick C1 protein